MSCTCHVCKKQYKVDILVPDDVWESIKPKSSENEAGLLCPTCIIERIESKYGYFTLQFIHATNHVTRSIPTPEPEHDIYLSESHTETYDTTSGDTIYQLES